MKQFSAVILTIIICLQYFYSNAQIVVKDSTETVPAGAQYKASHWKEIWWGKHYRKEWITPVSFPVINLDSTAGGLTPIKMGGGHETKSLRLKGADGKEYVLRTMDKNLNILVPEDFRGTFINDIVNDQISVAHPYGPIAAASLADAAGLYHTNPTVVFVTYSSRLKEFNKIFADKLCIFEERPSGDGWANTPLTGNAEDVVNTDKLLEKLRDDNDKKVDQLSYLRVRLFDIWINDWDRHEDQWIWLAHKHNDKTIYEAFGRDRDQAFSKPDGVNLYFISRPWVLPALQNIDKPVKNVIGTMLSARYIDKQFLNALTKDEWRKEIISLQATLTNDKIAKAVHSLPDTIFKISGEKLIQRLISRRDDMMRYALKYYDILNHQVDIIGSDKKELFKVNRISDDAVEVTVQKLNKNSVATDTMFHKTFSASETKFIYLYGLGGDDVYSTNGTANNIKVTFIGGEGKDSYLADSATTFNKIKVYDSTDNKEHLIAPFKAHFSNDTLHNDYNRRAFKYDWYAPFIIPGYNVDDGIFLGAGFTYKKQRWGKIPYAWEQTFGASVALKTGATNFFYSGRFSQVFGKWNLLLNASYKGPEYIFNFYGFGNDTKLLTDDRSYNRVRIQQFISTPGIYRTFRYQTLALGGIIENVKVASNNNRFIKQPQAGVDSLVFNSNTYAGAYINYNITHRDNDKFTSKGYDFKFSSVYKNNITTGKKDFVNLASSFSFYVPLGELVLAHRTGGATNFGNFEFYHANTLGGSENLRGFYRTRFTGKSSFYQNTELRYAFANLHGYVLRGKLGMYAFFDDGRVWIKDEHSDKIHTAFGPGFFYIPYSAAVINVSYGISSEKSLVRVDLGFLF